MTDERTKYLEKMADDYGIDEDTVFSVAEILGEDEDYDGLVNALEDCLFGKF